MTDPDERERNRSALPREPPSLDEADKLIANSEVHANAWEETLDELARLEEAYEADGWETLRTFAGHTGPVAPVHQKGYWGLSYIVPDSDAERIGDFVDTREFPKYDVLRSTVHGRVFMAVILLDADTETAIFLASNYELRRASELVEHTHEVGYVNSIVRHLDGRIVAEVRHDDPEKFFPRHEEFGMYGENWRSNPGPSEQS